MAFSVLIVDDSRVMRMFVARTLEVSGFPVHEYFNAENGQEALEIIRRERPDVVLSDINMPVMDGEEMMAQMDGDASLRLIPVVVISTDSSENRVRRMLSMGARGYVNKPFQPETLREELERVLEVTNSGY